MRHYGAFRDGLRWRFSHRGLLPCLQIPEAEAMAPAPCSHGPHPLYPGTSHAVFWNWNNSHPRPLGTTGARAGLVPGPRCKLGWPLIGPCSAPGRMEEWLAGPLGSEGKSGATLGPSWLLTHGLIHRDWPDIPMRSSLLKTTLSLLTPTPAAPAAVGRCQLMVPSAGLTLRCSL